MSAKLFSSGVFTKEVSTFFNNSSIIYTIATRKKPTLNKPKNYILAKTTAKTFYISSLYPTKADNIFNADYEGEKYTLVFEPNKVIVSLRKYLK